MKSLKGIRHTVNSFSVPIEYHAPAGRDSAGYRLVSPKSLIRGVIGKETVRDGVRPDNKFLYSTDTTVELGGRVVVDSIRFKIVEKQNSFTYSLEEVADGDEGA